MVLGLGSTKAATSLGMVSRTVPESSAPSAGAANSLPASLATAANSPAEAIPAKSDSPLAPTVALPAPSQAPELSSHLTSGRLVPAGSCRRFGRTREAGSAKSAPRGPTRKAAAGDHPAGSTPCNPCAPIWVRVMAESSASEPAGMVRVAIPPAGGAAGSDEVMPPPLPVKGETTVPPRTEGTVPAAAAAGVSRASVTRRPALATMAARGRSTRE